MTWFDDEPVVAAAESADHVVVRLAGGRYCLRATDVAEVVPVPVLTRLPGAPRWIRGVANWRGHVLPVVDLRPVLQVGEPALPSSARVVVLSVADVEVGLLAEAVDGLLEVPAEVPLPPPTVPTAALVTGVHDAGPRGLVAVLGTAEILALAHRG